MTLAFAALVCLAPATAAEPIRRGSWIETGPAGSGAVVLVANQASRPVIVVPEGEKPNVRVAARFLAGDIRSITGVEPEILAATPAGRPFIALRTQTTREWEAYTVRTVPGGIEITGSNPRGTAFGAYELCERLGVDPLHRWTGYVPERHLPLVVKKVDFHQGPPDVKFRGFFHDDEDVFPRPMIPLQAADGGIGPDPNGVVSLDDYKRFFETALRLKMNMVAPWVRTNRYPAVERLADRWGLYLTSHHYDTLLSDPYHFTRPQQKTPFNDAKPGLAELRGVNPEWDFVSNRDGMVRFWKGGVEENHAIDCIWPIGLRGTNDYSYKWPEGYTQEQILGAYEDAFRIQTELVKAQVPPTRERLFHFTMYTEMLPYYQTGKLRVPEDAIIVWPDNNDGFMRGLPSGPHAHKHGVYYHLAYLGGNISKQTAQIVPLERVESEFRKIFEAGATEYMLVNVSDLREYLMGARFLSDLCWNGRREFESPGAADRFLGWWCREYFGVDGPVEAAYRAYFASIPDTTDYGYGALKCLGAIPSLRLKFEGKPFAPAQPDTLPTLLARQLLTRRLEARVAEGRAAIRDDLARRFYFENLELAAAIDRLTTEAGVLLVSAMAEPDRNKALRRCREALVPLEHLEALLQRANRPPFEHWYGPSWTVQRDNHIVLPRVRLEALLREFGA
ncbi:MAG: glycosyl hydrolase 115 family protein [Fimbriimonadaceae bacterium]|nr:glycosyl hydrolase 115 family protein [Fimbriimonadaceae bacterium]